MELITLTLFLFGEELVMFIFFLSLYLYIQVFYICCR